MMKNSTKKSTLLFYFPLLLLLGLLSNSLDAQIVLSTNDAQNGTKTIPCPGNKSFTDDDTNSGLYFDASARKDTIILCPSSSSFQIKVTFSSFDVANGDELKVFDGDLSKNPGAPMTAASGTGVSQAFGGWVVADCNPAINPTGCLTFVFETNGDNAKGNGWQASITCENSAVVVKCPTDISVREDCSNGNNMISVDLYKPTFTTCDGTVFSKVNITSTYAGISGNNITADGSFWQTVSIPLGTYSVTATSVVDNSKTCTYFIYADQSGITCNDNVVSTIGFNCSARITVDDVLENPCVGTGTTYKIEIDLNSKGKTLSATVDGSSFNAIASDGLDVSSSDFVCGSQYAVTITKIVNGLEKSCTGQVRFVDNSSPSIQVSAQTITTCGGLTDAEIKKKLSISVFDNCDVRDTIISIGTFPSNFCASGLSVPVTITAIDFCGNSSTKTINVGIIRPTAFFAPRDTALGCGSGTTPAIAGYPMLDTDGDGIGDLPIIDNTCNFIPIFTDQVVTANGTTKIFRTWQVKDWCNQATPVTLPVQLIEIKDTGKPAINCPSSNERGTINKPHIIYTGNNNCNATINLSPPTGSVACGGTVTVNFNRAFSLPDSTLISNINQSLPVGKYLAEYYARDAQGNRSDTCSIYFDIRDGGIPSAKCTDELNVSFVNDEVRIKVEDIDAGSGDNCSIITKEIRKEGGNWGQEVYLTCQEVANSNKVYLRVTDENGGQNTCWTIITGHDSSVPTCGQLIDQTIACDDFHINDFGASTDANDNKSFDDNEWKILTGSFLSTYNQQFGNPNCGNNSACGAATSVEQYYQLVPGLCGGTKIKRRYRATDGGVNQSVWKEQLITLTFDENFTVNFPADWTGNCGDNFPVAGLGLDTKGCNVLAWTHEDKRFDGVNGACYIIERTYSVTNWCSYSAGQDALELARTEDAIGFSANGLTVTNEDISNSGLFEYVQVLKITDNTIPTITIATVDECLNGATCSNQKTFSISADDCLGTDGLTYSYELLDNGAVLRDGITTSFSTTVSNKTYQVKWTVSDNCGNTAKETVTYTFKDCARPNPVCADGVALVIDSGTKTATIWATDLNLKSIDNCSSEDKLEFRVWHQTLANTISKPESGDAGSVVLALPKNVALDCDYLGSQSVEFYVIDEAGNWDFCVAGVFIQDGSGVCGAALIDSTDVAMVAGGIFTTGGIPLKEVNLHAKGTALYEKTISTNQSGIFEMNLPKGIGYVITFEKEDDMMNGISVADIILVTKHILGVTPFNSPYQFIAADINKSGSVTTFDAVQLRKMLLGIDTNFANEAAWRFVKVGYNFETENPAAESFTETILIPELTENLTELDFVAIKTGDLNGSVKVDGLTTTKPRNETNPLLITIKDRTVKKGELIEVNFTLDDLQQIEGFQYALSFNGLALQSIQNGIIAEQHYAKKSDNRLAVCWDKFTANLDNKNQDNLFTLNFRVQKNGQLSELLTLSEFISAEGINQTEEVLAIQLNFENTIKETSFELFQNKPNPFSTKTVIGFNLAEQGEVILEVFNMQGALLKELHGTFESGYNELQIQKSDLEGNGVLLYQIKTKEGVAFKKMILLE